MRQNTQATIRHKLFADKFVLDVKPASHAYAEVYGGDSKSNSTRAAASRLLKNPAVQEALSRHYKLDSEILKLEMKRDSLENSVKQLERLLGR